MIAGAAPESSNRGFGSVFAAAFSIIAGWPLPHWPRWWTLTLAVAFAAVALVRLLYPLKRVWLAVGRLLAFTPPQESVDRGVCSK